MVARTEPKKKTPQVGPDVRAAMVLCLQKSALFLEYRQAFEATTGLPLVLRAAGSFQAPLQGSKQANPFCSLMIGANKTCSSCLQLQQRVETEAVLTAKTLRCYAGLSESAVPVRVGNQVLAYLQTGQVFLGTQKKFESIIRPASTAGSAAENRRMESAYFQTRVISRTQYAGIIRLLGIFAEHLATVSNSLLTSQTTTESPTMTKARAFIDGHQDGAIGLVDAARAVNMSPFYFCKVFKKTTGLTFTDYLARARIETVKRKLLDAHLRVSEAAFASGFQSLSQFNRVFLRVAGETPCGYRERLHGPRAKLIPLPDRTG